MSKIFIALTPDPVFNKVICELKEDQNKFLIRNHKVNWSKNNQHHITINFIGSMEPEQKEELFTNLENRSAFKDLPIEIDSLSYFPNENGQVLIANITQTPRLFAIFLISFTPGFFISLDEYSKNCLWFFAIKKQFSGNKINFAPFFEA